MNEYKICFSIFPIDKSNKNHFSNCKAVIKGTTYEEAMKKFKKEQKEDGQIVAFEFEGDDVAKIEFFDKN